MRAECVRLSGLGRTALEVAGILAVHPVTVRRALRRFTAGATAALGRRTPFRASAEGHQGGSG
ncbi:hypothetical protein, partial [Streptomyces sp. NPDC001774]